MPGEQVADRVEQTVTALRDAEKELEKLRAQMVLGGAAALWRRRPGTWAASRTSAPRRPRARRATTCVPSPRRSAARIDAARPAVVAVASRSNGKASLIVAVNGAARGRGLSAADLVKGALSGRGGGNADLAQGGGVPADQVPVLLAAVEKAVAGAAG